MELMEEVKRQVDAASWAVYQARSCVSPEQYGELARRLAAVYAYADDLIHGRDEVTA